MKTSKSHFEPQPSWDRAATFILIHSGLLAAFLLYCRLKKLSLGVPRATILDYALVGLPDIGMLLLIQAGWLLSVRSDWAKKFRSWPTLYLLFHLPIYALSVTGQRYYLETRNIQNGEMLSYMLSNLAAAGEVLTVGLDAYFVGLSIAAICIVLSMVLVARLRLRLRKSSHILVAACALLAGVGGLFAPLPRLSAARPLSGNFLSDLFPNPARAEHLARTVPDWIHYKAPQVTAQQATSKRRPDILLVLLESTRRDVFSAYGADPSLMPRFNEFLKDAAVVEDAYVGVSHTTKELVTIHCGMYPPLVMSLDSTLPGGVHMPCLPHLLTPAGYSSAFFQTAGDFERRSQLLINLGYDFMFVPNPESARGAQRRGYLGWDESLMLSRLSSWLSEEHSEPRLTTLLTLTTHHPYMFKKRVPEDADEVRRSYLQAASAVDASIGQFLLDKKREGKLEDTIVVVTGDHGEAFGERPGFQQHDVVPFEEVTHIPLFIIGPNIPQGTSISGLRHHLDLLPTLLRLADVPVTGHIPGRDLLSSPGQPFVVTSCWYQAHCLSLRQGQLSFVYYFGTQPMEVYDLDSDPKQLRDISAQVPIQLREQATQILLGTYHSSIETRDAGSPPPRARAPRMF